MAGPLDASGRTGNYIQCSSRYFLDKAIYDQQVVEDLVCVETAEWTVSADALREHLERLHLLQQSVHEEIRITEDNSGIIIVERRMDMERCRVITTYTPEGMERKAGQDEMFPRSHLDLIRILRRINGRRQYFERTGKTAAAGSPLRRGKGVGVAECHFKGQRRALGMAGQSGKIPG